jgi:hypothetical protein
MPSQATTKENSTAGVIPAAPWRIQALSVLPGHRLAVTFRDGTSGIADCSGICSSSNPGIYAPLADESFFAQAAIELGVIVWPNGADLDPCWAYENMSFGKTWSVPF